MNFTVQCHIAVLPIMLLWHGQWHLYLFISWRLFWDSLVSPLVFPSRIPIKLAIWKKSLLQDTFSLMLLFPVFFLHNACYNGGTAQFWLYRQDPPPLALCCCLLAHSWNVTSFGLMMLSHALFVTDRCSGGHIISNCNAGPTCMNSGIMLTYSW